MSVSFPLGLLRFLREGSSNLLPRASCEDSTLLEPEEGKRAGVGDGFTIQIYVYLNPPFQ